VKNGVEERRICFWKKERGVAKILEAHDDIAEC
jgi:hypothetical protein